MKPAFGLALLGALIAAQVGCQANPDGASPAPTIRVGASSAPASQSGQTCSLEIRAEEDRYIATGFPPDEQVTISFTRLDDGRRQTAAEPLWRTDVRGRLEVYLAPSRADVGLHRVEFEAGGCVATAELEIPASRFPPECEHTPRADATPPPGVDAADEVARDSPDAWWRLDETTLGPVRDERGEHGGRHVGSVVPGVAGAREGGLGVGLSEDGWIDVDDIQLAGDFTIESWVRLCDVIDASDALVGGDAAPPDLNFRELRLRLWSGAVEAVIATSAAKPEAWGHWAVVRRAGIVRIWHGGVLAGDGSFDGTFTIAGLGRGTVGTLSGALDEVAVWQRALSPERIGAHAGPLAP